VDEIDERDAHRQLWRMLEAVHAVVYFAPEAKAVWTGVGLRGFWRSYLASRSAALGTPGARVVTALFFGFAPRMVEQAVPAVWEVAEPALVMRRRAALAASVLAGHTAAVPPERLQAAADRLSVLVDRLDVAGRPLAAAHADAPAPADAVGRVWHTATVLREYRGDGHVAALVDVQVDGVQANVWHAAAGVLVPEQRSFRGWTEEEWAAAADALRTRGWLDADGLVTAAGRRAREEVEARTDRSAALALRGLGSDDLAMLLGTLGPAAHSIAEHGAVPYPNAMGVPQPRLP
jgi:hypothetical protein